MTDYPIDPNSEQYSAVVLVQGNREEGNAPFWAYLALFEGQEDAYMQAAERGGFRLEEFGDILEWDEGEAPSQAVVDRLKTDFDIDHTLHDRLLEEISRIAEEEEGSEG